MTQKKNEMKEHSARIASSSLTERAKAKSYETSKSSFPLVKVSIAFFAVLVLVLTVFLSYNAGKGSSSSQQQSATSETSVSKTKASVSGKSADQDRKDATEAARKLLVASKTTSGDYKTRVKKIEAGDSSSVTKGMKNGVYMTDNMDSDDIRNVTYEALVALSANIFKNGDPQVQGDTWKTVQVDQTHGVAYVPMGVFTGTDIPFYFEMVYTKDGWKLAPYSFIQSVKMSSMMSSSQTNSGSK